MHRISGWWCLLQVVKRFYLDALEAARARRRRDRIEADVAYWPFSDLTRCPSCVRNTDQQALAGADLDNKLRAEISEIADLLQGNLDKVVQHGKRDADAIVKNMLLHSREGSGEHRPVDINAVASKN